MLGLISLYWVSVRGLWAKCLVWGLQCFVYLGSSAWFWGQGLWLGRGFVVLGFSVLRMQIMFFGINCFRVGRESLVLCRTLVVWVEARCPESGDPSHSVFGVVCGVGVRVLVFGVSAWFWGRLLLVSLLCLD